MGVMSCGTLTTSILCWIDEGIVLANLYVPRANLYIPRANLYIPRANLYSPLQVIHILFLSTPFTRTKLRWPPNPLLIQQFHPTLTPLLSLYIFHTYRLCIMFFPLGNIWLLFLLMFSSCFCFSRFFP